MKNKLLAYYKEICTLEGIIPIPIIFGYVEGGFACCLENAFTCKPIALKFDLDKLYDMNNALYHEVAHQIDLLKRKKTNHDKQFTKIYNYLCEKYVYSRYEFKYQLKNC